MCIGRRSHTTVGVVALALLLVAAPLALAGGQGEGAASGESGEDVTITWATIAGFYTDWAEVLADEFAAETGVNVEIIQVDYAQLYEKQVIEMVGGTGAYDIVTYDTGWKPEFINAGWLAPLDDYIAEADPDVIAFDDFSPAIIELSTRWLGEVYGIPYYDYTMGQFVRWDLFTDPDEREAFEEEYGYPLDLPQTYEQLADIAEFFHRQPGETLKGEVLEQEFYGIGLMAGRFPQIQDEVNSIAWTRGGKIINDDGSPGVTEPRYREAVEFYAERLLPHAPPGATTSAYDEVVGQMRQGLIAQTAAMYLDQWPNMVKTEDEVAGAEIRAAGLPGGHTWMGTFNMGLSRDSEHPQAAFDFMAFLASPEAQRSFAEGGGTTSRQSILTDESFVSQRRASIGHYPVVHQIHSHAEATEFYPNFYYITQTGKVYDEMTAFLSAAASGQMTVDRALNNLADAIEGHCGGDCRLYNDHLGANYTPAPQPTAFNFDKRAWIAD